MPKMKTEALRQLEDTREIMETLLFMPEKDLWKFILTGGVDRMDPNAKAQLITGLVLKARAALGMGDTYDMEAALDELRDKDEVRIPEA